MALSMGFPAIDWQFRLATSGMPTIADIPEASCFPRRVT